MISSASRNFKSKEFFFDANADARALAQRTIQHVGSARDGGPEIQQILETIKPEAAYFTDQDGQRGGTLVVNLDDPSGIPALAEPWFLTFHADIQLKVAMTPEDLGRSGLDSIGKKWG